MADGESRVISLSTDASRLLPGEDPESRDQSDARHWVAIYSQLKHVKDSLIGTLRELMEGQSSDAQGELERADVRLLQLQRARFERRLAFWQQRLADAPARAPV
ncbi:MAG: hypothetical protein ABI838_01070 [Chloroflexota bacterium]